MNYPQGDILAQQVEWYEKNFVPRLQEAVNNLHLARNGKFLERKFIIGRGERLAEHLMKAMEAEKELNKVENK